MQTLFMLLIPLLVLYFGNEKDLPSLLPVIGLQFGSFSQVTGRFESDFLALLDFIPCVFLPVANEDGESSSRPQASFSRE